MNRKQNLAISLNQVSKEISSGSEILPILSDINLSIPAGESLAIIGASGSGKTTLLGLMAGLDLPTRGDIHVFGHLLTDCSEEARTKIRAEHIGFVFQNFQLMPALSAIENVSFPLELTQRANAKVRAEKWLTKVGLSHRLHHYPHQLSGGEMQRVAVARAFALEPSLLLADEPTGDLDWRNSDVLVKLLFDLNAQEGTTLVIVTHDRALAKRCHQQFELIQGQLT